jgi:hypothetical protein
MFYYIYDRDKEQWYSYIEIATRTDETYIVKHDDIDPPPFTEISYVEYSKKLEYAKEYETIKDALAQSNYLNAHFKGDFIIIDETEANQMEKELLK